jgi:hypothetical protein
MTTHDEVSAWTGWERESFGLAIFHVQYELSSLPHLILTVINVEGAVADGADQHVVISDDELTLTKAHRNAALATTSR